MNPELQAFIQKVSIAFIPFLMAVVFHEWAHGFMAWLWGDKTAQEQGRLTLNPLPHLDPLGTVIFPLITMGTGIGFGWAKPVPIDPRRFRRYRLGLFMVSIAGVAMNFVLAMVGVAAFLSLERWAPHEFYLFQPLQEMSRALIMLNCSLFVFNLLPFPPLDGSKVIESMLPRRLAEKYESLSRFGAILLLGLMFTGALKWLIFPINLVAMAAQIPVAMVFRIFGAL